MQRLYLLIVMFLVTQYSAGETKRHKNQDTMGSNVFFIFRIEYNPLELPKGEQILGTEDCFKGTCFFVSKDYFFTAHHVFNEKTFQPTRVGCVVKVFLVNQNGYVINDPAIDVLFPEADVTIGKASNLNFHYKPKLANTTMEKFVNNKALIMGRAANLTNKVEFDSYIEDSKITILKPITDILLQPIIVTISDLLSIRAMDSDDGIKIRNHKAFQLDESVPIGYSGGPLVSKDGYIIGVQSMNNVKISNSQNKLLKVISLASFLP